MKERKSNQNGVDAPRSFEEIQKEQLITEDNFLRKVVDTIPPKMYFCEDIRVQITKEKHLAMDKAAEGLKRKANHEISAKQKHKRARLDPSCQKSVTQIQNEMKEERIKKKKNILFPSATLTRAAGIEELQRRLHERIEGFQSKRSKLDLTAEEKRQRRKEKEEAQNQKKKNRKKKENKIKQEINHAPNENHTAEEENSPQKPIYNKEGKIIYSKFDFSETGEETKGKSKGKNYKKLLQDVEQKKLKIESLKQADSAKAETVIQNNMWKRAIQKSEGVKLKDDPTLLKKALKKQEKKKGKSAKQWKERIENTEKLKKQRQEKRAKNIKARKQDKLQHKVKRLKKRGRIVPGLTVNL